MSKPDKLDIIWANTGVSIEPADAKYELGWEAEIPPYQYLNYVQNKTDKMLDHINTYGIPEWDSVTEYKLGSRVLYSGVKYKCVKVTSTDNQPDLLVDWFKDESDQNLDTTSAVTFDTVNTGQGDNELYAMDQDVKTDSDVTLNDAIFNGSVSLTTTPTSGRWTASLTPPRGLYMVSFGSSEALNGAAVIKHSGKVIFFIDDVSEGATAGGVFFADGVNTTILIAGDQYVDWFKF